MARLKVSGMIWQWLHQLETDTRMMDKLEMMFSTKYVVRGSCVREQASCCVSCQCEQCVRSEHRTGDRTMDTIKDKTIDRTEDRTEDSDSSVLTEYRYQCGCVEESYTYQGRRVGRSRRRKCDGSVSRTDYRQGARHGFSLTLTREGRLHTAGWWSHGEKTDTWWTSVLGGAWLVTNTNSHQAIFIYPDLVTALLGNISSETFTAQTELSVCEVTSLSLEAGLLLPGLARCKGNVPPASGLTKSVLHHPEVRDPYESKVVEVRQSLIPQAGDGLFTKAAVEKGVIVSYFAGVVVEGLHSADSEYSISWLDGAGLDIPGDIRQSYCSTLGHKACHSFSPNCEYSWAVHPRFGKIRAIVSLRPLEAGEEVLTDYKYSYSKAPQWYRDDLSNFLINNFNMETADIAEYINRMEKDRKCAVPDIV